MKTVTRKCICCDRDLTVDESIYDMDSPEGSQRIQCECGLVYAAKLVFEIEEEHWEKVRKREGFKVERVSREEAVITDLEARKSLYRTSKL